MNITIEKTVLLNALTRISGIVARRETIAILSHVLIDARDNTLTIRATNGDMEATVTVAAAVSKAGVTCVSADKMTAIVKAAADGAEISMTLKDRLEVKSGRSHFKVATLPAEDFPTFVPFEPASEFTVPADALADIMGRVSFAVTTDASRYIMSGVHLFSDGAMGGAVAADGLRMAVSERAVDWPEFAVTVPMPMTNEMLKLAGPLTIRVGAKIQVEAPGVVITSKVIDGAYIPYRRTIPTVFASVATVDVEAMTWAVRRAALAADDKGHSVRLSIGQGRITVSARGFDTDAADETECEFDGEPFDLGVNSMFMLDALGAIKSESVEFAFQDWGERKDGSKFVRPFRIRTPGDETFLNVVCPLGLS